MMAYPELARDLAYDARKLYEKLEDFTIYNPYRHIIENEMQGLKYSDRDIYALSEKHRDHIKQIQSQTIESLEEAINTTFTNTQNNIIEKKNQYLQFKSVCKLFYKGYDNIANLIIGKSWEKAIEDLKSLENNCNEILSIEQDKETKPIYKKILETTLYCYEKYVAENCSKKDIREQISSYKQNIERYKNVYENGNESEYTSKHFCSYAVAKMKNAVLIGAELKTNGKVGELFILTDEAIEEGMRFNKECENTKEYKSVFNLWLQSVNILFKKSSQNFDLRKIQKILAASKKISDRSCFEHPFMQSDRNNKFDSKAVMSVNRTFEFFLEYYSEHDYKTVKNNFGFLNKILEKPNEWGLSKSNIQGIYNLWCKCFLKNEKRSPKVDFNLVFSFANKEIKNSLLDEIFSLFRQKEYTPEKETFVSLSEKFLSTQNLNALNPCDFMHFASHYILCEDSVFGKTESTKRGKYSLTKDVPINLKIRFLTVAIFKNSKGVKQLSAMKDKELSECIEAYYSAYKTLFGTDAKKLSLKCGQNIKEKTINVAKAVIVSETRKKRIKAIVITLSLILLAAVGVILFILLR